MDWGDNTTAVTGVSDLGFALDAGAGGHPHAMGGGGAVGGGHVHLMSRWPRRKAEAEDEAGLNDPNSSNSYEEAEEEEPRWRFLLRRFSGPAAAAAAAAIAFLSPPLMLLAPVAGWIDFTKAPMRCHVRNWTI